jgi:hypothetical protein
MDFERFTNCQQPNLTKFFSEHGQQVPSWSGAVKEYGLSEAGKR